MRDWVALRKVLARIGLPSIGFLFSLLMIVWNIFICILQKEQAALFCGCPVSILQGALLGSPFTDNVQNINQCQSYDLVLVFVTHQAVQKVCSRMQQGKKVRLAPKRLPNPEAQRLA